MRERGIFSLRASRTILGTYGDFMLSLFFEDLRRCQYGLREMSDVRHLDFKNKSEVIIRRF